MIKMRLVLDNNIFFSLMNPKSVNSYLFSLGKIKFIAPEFLKSELGEHKSECIAKSELSEQEFEIRQREVEEKIEFIKLSEYKSFLKEALASVPDTDDAPYLALALSVKSPIWSNDMHFKQQSSVKVFTTEKLIKCLFGYEV